MTAMRILLASIYAMIHINCSSLQQNESAQTNSGADEKNLEERILEVFKSSLKETYKEKEADIKTTADTLSKTSRENLINSLREMKKKVFETDKEKIIEDLINGTKELVEEGNFDTLKKHIKNFISIEISHEYKDEVALIKKVKKFNENVGEEIKKFIDEKQADIELEKGIENVIKNVIENFISKPEFEGKIIQIKEGLIKEHKNKLIPEINEIIKKTTDKEEIYTMIGEIITKEYQKQADLNGAIDKIIKEVKISLGDSFEENNLKQIETEIKDISKDFYDSVESESKNQEDLVMDDLKDHLTSKIKEKLNGKIQFKLSEFLESELDDTIKVLDLKDAELKNNMNQIMESFSARLLSIVEIEKMDDFIKIGETLEQVQMPKLVEKAIEDEENLFENIKKKFTEEIISRLKGLVKEEEKEKLEEKIGEYIEEVEFEKDSDFDSKLEKIDEDIPGKLKNIILEDKVEDLNNIFAEKGILKIIKKYAFKETLNIEKEFKKLIAGMTSEAMKDILNFDQNKLLETKITQINDKVEKNFEEDTDNNQEKDILESIGNIPEKLGSILSGIILEDKKEQLMNKIKSISETVKKDLNSKFGKEEGNTIEQEKKKLRKSLNEGLENIIDCDKYKTNISDIAEKIIMEIGEDLGLKIQETKAKSPAVVQTNPAAVSTKETDSTSKDSGSSSKEEGGFGGWVWAIIGLFVVAFAAGIYIWVLKPSSEKSK